MKMKCSVIQDLLPSYVDNICSEDTRELVQEHIAECGQCREKLEQMKNTEIVAGKAAKRQVDYLKKIHSTLTHREGVGKLLLVILVGIAYVGLFVGGGGLLDYPRIPFIVVSALFFCAAVLAGNYRFSGGRKNAAALEIGVSGAVFILVMAVQGYFVWAVCEELKNNIVFPFNIMEPYEFGPFDVNILRIFALIPAAVLLWNAFGKYKNAYATTLNIAAVGYIVYANDWLYHMDDAGTSIQFIKKLTITQTVLAAVGLIAFALLRKFGKMSEGAENL